MNPNNPYFKQVQFLVQILPTLEAHPVFALKGGTAINLFIRDLPRLSVDIDLAYAPVKGREESLKDIHQNLLYLSNTLQGQGLKVQKNNPNSITRLTVANQYAQIKIETSPILRGSVHPVVTLAVTQKVEERFGYAQVQSLSFDDIYAGKLCAALDRQHPRDLFDVKGLLENEGLSTKLKDTFLVYLISHPRPMHELLNPHLKDITESYATEFESMTTEKVSLDDLKEVRLNLIQQLQTRLTDEDKAFLLSVKNKNADWSGFVYPEIADLPAIKWKIYNLHSMTAAKHKIALNKLANLLQTF